MRALEVVLPVCRGAESGRTLTKAGQVYEMTVVVANCHLPETLGSGMGCFSEQRGLALVEEIFSRYSWVGVMYIVYILDGVIYILYVLDVDTHLCPTTRITPRQWRYLPNLQQVDRVLTRAHMKSPTPTSP
jgi:hypothetical protein